MVGWQVKRGSGMNERAIRFVVVMWYGGERLEPGRLMSASCGRGTRSMRNTR